MPTANELRRIGFTPGREERWCGCGCNRLFRGGPTAFKRKECAVQQWDELEADCEKAGMEE